MHRETKDKHFVKKPYYEGGPTALKAFITKNLKYPEEARKNEVEGTVHVRYTISQKGKVTDTKVIAGIGHGCDEEAQRLVRLLKFTVPKNHINKVKFHKTIHIHFRLPKKKAQAGTSYQYTITSSDAEKKDNTGKQPPSKGGYSYTIKLG